MTERVRTQPSSSSSSSAATQIRDIVGFAVSTGSLALTRGAAGVPEALVKGWMTKSGVTATTAALTKVLPG